MGFKFMEMKRTGLIFGTLGVIMVGLVGGLLYKQYLDEQARQERYRQLISIISIDKVPAFDQKYNSLAIDNVYNQTVLDYGRLWDSHPDLAEHGILRYKSMSDIPTLTLYIRNSTLLSEIYRTSQQDVRVSVDRFELTEDISDLCLYLNLAKENLLLPTVQALGNLTLANKQLNHPSFNRTDLWSLTNATQVPGYGPFLSADPDKDGLTTYDEIFTYGTNPLDPDTDKDENLDGEEALLNSSLRQFGDRVTPGYIDPLKFSPIWRIEKTESFDGTDIFIYYFGKQAFEGAGIGGCGGGLGEQYILTFLSDPQNAFKKAALMHSPIFNIDWKETNGEFAGQDIIRDFGRYVAYRQIREHPNFELNYTTIFYSLPSDYYTVICDVKSKIDIKKELSTLGNFMNLAWESNAYKYGALKNYQGEIKIINLTESVTTPTWHFRPYEKIFPKNGWIVAYDSELFDSSFAMTYLNGNVIYPNGTSLLGIPIYPCILDAVPPEGDALELHLIMTPVLFVPMNIESGTQYNFNYRLIYNLLGKNRDYSWVDEIYNKAVNYNP